MFMIGIALVIRVKSKEVDKSNRIIKRNPDFYKDENACMRLYNNIMKE